jgi:hypothetical protein
MLKPVVMNPIAIGWETRNEENDGIPGRTNFFTFYYTAFEIGGRKVDVILKKIKGVNISQVSNSKTDTDHSNYKYSFIPFVLK